MRMMMKVSIPTAKGNEAIKNESLPKTIEGFLKEWKPEAAYFTSECGQRTGFFFFDMKDPTQIPSIAEPFFMALDAEVTFAPCMNPDDLRAGLGKLAKK
jgi:hypothetical protein